MSNKFDSVIEASNSPTYKEDGPVSEESVAICEVISEKEEKRKSCQQTRYKCVFLVFIE